MDLIQIDGSLGEGGGQMLRSALALSVISGRPFAMDNIRANRAKPGLARQHLACAQAAAAISGAAIEGDSVGSQRLKFRPGSARSGDYRFAVGTAGSAPLVFQTIALPLLLADGPSRVVFEGGTHNMKAPSFDFVDAAFLPLVRRMGGELSLKLERLGFYPKGQGRFVAEIAPSRLRPIELLERGALRGRAARADLCNLHENIGQRELSVLAEVFGLLPSELELKQRPNSPGVGNALYLRFDYENVIEMFTAVGERGLAAAAVARQVADEANRYLESGAPVGPYLADQLLLPLAIAGGGRFRAVGASQHFLSNKEIIEMFLDVEIVAQREERLSWLVEIRRKAASDANDT